MTWYLELFSKHIELFYMYFRYSIWLQKREKYLNLFIRTLNGLKDNINKCFNLKSS